MISVLLADDNLIVREGVRAMLSREPDIEVVAVAADHDGLLTEAERTLPQVVVTDIRMPPDFQREGIDAAQTVRKRQPGTGVVILSQYDDPEYAVSLLAEGSAGYAYLLKQHVADGDQLARAVRAVATGGTSLDPVIVDALMRPVQDDSLTRADQELLAMVASGMPIKAIAVSRRVPPEAAAFDVERLFQALATDAAAGKAQGLERLRMPPPARRRDSSGSGCCTGPSSTVRSRARRCRACCRAAWPPSSAPAGCRPRANRSWYR